MLLRCLCSCFVAEAFQTPLSCLTNKNNESPFKVQRIRGPNDLVFVKYANSSN